MLRRPLGTYLSLVHTMRSSRGPSGRGSRKILIRALSYGAVVLSAAWAGYWYSYDMVVPPSGAEPVGFAAAETATIAAVETREEEKAAAAAAAAEVVWEGATSRAPWDPKGCQTLVFFHVPKTGGESVNDLWVDMKGRERLSWWKEGYQMTSMRITGLEPEKQEGFLKSM